MKNFLSTFILVTVSILLMLGLISIGGLIAQFQPSNEKAVAHNTILSLELEGIIIDPKELLEDLVHYSADPKIKGVLLRVNSPGGVVGPSQELYTELKRIRTELKKPVVVSAGGLMASGAYYTAVAADKIVVNPGTLMGSIGVIMEFVNLESLYDWAKIKRYSIKTGLYKDSGADYRGMREDEKLLFLDLMNEVLGQFKKAVSEGRKLPMETVTKYADGRIFNGEGAVKLGFADQMGTFEDAKRLILKMTRLDAKTELFTPPKKRRELMELFGEVKSPVSDLLSIENLKKKLLPSVLGQPLFIWNGALGL